MGVHYTIFLLIFGNFCNKKKSSPKKFSDQTSQELRILQESCFGEMLWFLWEALRVRRRLSFSIPYHFLMAKWSLTRIVWQQQAASTQQQSGWWSTKYMAVSEHLKLCLEEAQRMNHNGFHPKGGIADIPQSTSGFSVMSFYNQIALPRTSHHCSRNEHFKTRLSKVEFGTYILWNKANVYKWTYK